MSDVTAGRSGGEAEAVAGVPLRELLLALGEPVLDVAAAPEGLDVRVDNVVILDPEDRTEVGPGDLVLLVGVRGAAARRLVRTVARQRAAAVAVKAGTSADEDLPPSPGRGRPRPGGDVLMPLRTEARESGIALLAVRPQVRWEKLQALCQGIVDNARLIAGEDLDEADSDLFSMAQTIARLTGGLVSIEDSASRVLAYSSSAEVDELRRLSVLGRRGPESYLALLREWGVFTRLRSGEEVVRIDEHPELGIRRRLAVGIHAGSRPLGSIWVQEGSRPLAEHAEEALLGAARATALHMIRRRAQTSAGLRLREDLLSSLLEGRIDADALAGTVEVRPERAALVVAFARAGKEDTQKADRSERELNRRRLVDLVSVHAAAYRRGSLVTELGGRVYALLPDLARGRQGWAGTEQGVVSLAGRTVAAARDALGLAVRAAVGSPAERLGDVPDSRAEADRVLDAMDREPEEGGREVATISDVRSQVLVGETLAHLRADPSLRDPRVTRLVEYDRTGNSELVRSLLAYLEAFGDARAAAERLHVHPNTLRYRVRRAASVSGIDLGDPGERLFTQLQLLLEQRERDRPG